MDVEVYTESSLLRNVHKNRMFLKVCSCQSTGQRYHGEHVAHPISAVE